MSLYILIPILFYVAHSLAESVEFSVYWLPSSNSSPTYQAKLLFHDRILYSDMSKYLAELLVQSNNDLSQVCDDEY